MFHSVARPFVLSALTVALLGAQACSSRYRLIPKNRQGEECSPAVSAETSAPQGVASESPDTHGDGTPNAANSSSSAPLTEHDCAAHAPHEDSSNGANASSLAESNGEPLDTSPQSPTHGNPDASSEAPFVVPPVVPTPGAPDSAVVSHAVMVSIDGLASRFLEQVIAEGNAPSFERLQTLAAWTHDARTDTTYTITLPNHTSMITGLPVWPALGFESFRAHQWTWNGDPGANETLHAMRSPARNYTPSVFDVAHDHGLSTALFASKSKFSLFAQTYNDAGGPDTVGKDNGRRKIDTVVINIDATALVDELVVMLSTQPANYTFVHLHQPDSAGHALGWGGPEYLAAVAEMDGLLGRIMTAISSGPRARETGLIVTTDHGGVGYGHYDPLDIQCFQIPFYVMAPGVPVGDAYAAFDNRFHPNVLNPEYQSERQPLRNGDSGNLALYLLGLPPIPESIMHSAGLRITH